jgi:hypothetical protein
LHSEHPHQNHATTFSLHEESASVSKITTNPYVKFNFKLGMWASRKSRYYDNKTDDYIYIAVSAYLPHTVQSLVIIIDTDYKDNVQTLLKISILCY